MFFASHSFSANVKSDRLHGHGDAHPLANAAWQKVSKRLRHYQLREVPQPSWWNFWRHHHIGRWQWRQADLTQQCWHMLASLQSQCVLL
jgi:hypothetical protein